MNVTQQSRPSKTLKQRIIEQAIRDLKDPDASPGQKEMARRILSASGIQYGAREVSNG